MSKLSVKENLGYGSASLGDAAAYGFIGTFLMFFLTTVAGIEPATAGILTAVGAVWNALINPVIGYCADKVNTRFGRRRPVILAFSIPLGITMFLLFTKIDLPDMVRPVYYGIMLMLFWTSYTGYFVPYLALGVEYTSDYDDRTILRLYASLFNMIGSIFAMVLPTMVVKLLMSRGLTLAEAWSATGAFVGSVTFLSILITVLVSGNKDRPADVPDKKKTEGFSLPAIFREYISVARLKPMKYLVIASIASLVCYQIIMSDLVYFLTYNLRFGATHISLFLLVRSLAGMVLIPVVGKIALAIDKRNTMIIFFLLGIGGMFFVRFVSLPEVPMLIAYVIFTCFCTCVYWDLMPSIYYDICEYDQLVNGRNRQATIVSFQGLVEAVALGIGSLILGVILQLGGFDGSAATQTIGAMKWIFNCTTAIPVLFLIIAALAIHKYPITKSVHEDIQRQLKK